MRNPYEVLEINEKATDEEVKKAYREQVKKYHPDQYANNPLSELAGEKLREVNEAYEAITKMRSSGHSNSTGSSSYGNNDITYIRDLINNGKFAEAERALNETSVRDAQWYYLMGKVYQKKGWYDNARNYYGTAASMDPSNYEYRKAVNDMGSTVNGYNSRSTGRGYNSGDNCCQFCQCLICTDCCCECMGSDLIACC